MAKRIPLPPGASVSPDMAGGTKFYRARIGSRLRAGGAVRKAFSTRAAAEAWIREQIKPAAKIGTAGLTAEQIEDARDALKILGGRASLHDAAKDWIRHRQGETITVRKAIETLESEHEAAEISLRHRQQTKATLLRFFGSLLSKPLADLTSEEMVAARDAKDAHGHKASPEQKVTRLRHAAILLNFSLKRGWIDKSPLSGVARPRLTQKKVEILTTFQAANLMFHAMQVAPHVVISLAIKLFAGLRNSELYVLDWRSITTGIRIEKSKTGKPRTVKISENLKAWMGDHPKEGRVWNHRPEVKDRESTWLEAMALVEAEAGFEIPQNALRHSFGSYHRQLCQSDDATAMQMGNTPAVVRRNYADAVSEEAAKIYWGITPHNCEARKDKPAEAGGPDEEAPEPGR